MLPYRTFYVFRRFLLKKIKTRTIDRIKLFFSLHFNYVNKRVFNYKQFAGSAEEQSGD